MTRQALGLGLRVLATCCDPLGATELSALKEALGINALNVTVDAHTGARVGVPGHYRLHVAPWLSENGKGWQQRGFGCAR